MLNQMMFFSRKQIGNESLRREPDWQMTCQDNWDKRDSVCLAR